MQTKSLILFKIIRKVTSIFQISDEMDSQKDIYENILKGANLRGTNMWIFICAIIIASVGLNVNSESIVIGAMLISPLMGSVVGIGYGVSTYDFKLLQKSLRTLLFAVTISLIASTLYFLLSPISITRSSMLAVLSPSIYDVIIAFFGGAAGIITSTSRSKGNAIPGAAVATALMPPLCKAGYGFSIGDISFSLNALYLFAINMVFIAFATFLISKALNLPTYQNILLEQKKRINRYISIVLIFVTLPSFYFAYKLVQKGRFQVQADKYVKSVSIFENLYLLRNEIDADNKKITLIYGGNGIDAKLEQSIKKRAMDFMIPEENIIVQGGLIFNNNDEEDDIEKQKLHAEIDRLYNDLKYNKQKLDSILENNKLGETLFLELHALFPVIIEISYAPAPSFSMLKNLEPVKNLNKDSSLSSSKMELSNNSRFWVIVKLNKTQKFIQSEREKLKNWLEVRLGRKVDIFYH